MLNLKKYFCQTFLYLLFGLCIIVPQKSYALQENPTNAIVKKPNVVYLLAIGNSFSEDAIENYLHELVKAAKKKIVIANLYIPGASLERHMSNVNDRIAAYSYRKIQANGELTVRENVDLATALQDEKWTLISFQQASPFSGNLASIQATLPDLFAYVKQVLNRADVQYIWHQTWAYSKNSTQEGFAHYANQQQNMYTAIVAVSQQINQVIPFQYMVPAGTAIQNARSSVLGDELTRDGYHLQLTYGRFTAACTWYEVLFKKDVRKNKFQPEDLSKLQIAIAKESAHHAAMQPFELTQSKYQ